MKMLKIVKGEKVIRIKATSKRVAHTRRIKSAKPKVEDRSEIGNRILNTVVSYYESVIKDQSFESAGAFDDSGRILLQKDGGKDVVKFDKKEMELCKGSTFTHNHPSDNSGFSPADVKFACQVGMKEMRTITSSNKGSSIKMKDGSNFTIDMWDKIGELCRTSDIETRSLFEMKIGTGEMTIEEANKSHWGVVWKNVFEKCPEIKYEVK